MATVYRAYDPMFEREVALKILNRELLDNPQIRERFERETKIIAKLEHPAIVPVHDVGKDNEQLFYVMRYMTGGSLSDRMAAEPFSLRETVLIIQRIAGALDYAHAKGVIHRDLKPGNILFDDERNAFISDFGIAKLAHGQTKLTSSGIIGTPTYMSPEQALGEEVDGRSDIYSLGVILFEMLSGELPYEATTPLAMVVKHVNEPIPHILDINPNLPEGIEAVLEKALAKNRNLRYTTAMALFHDLLAALPENIPTDPIYALPATTRSQQPTAQANRAESKAVPDSPPLRTWVFGGLALLAVLVLIFWQNLRLSTASKQPTPTLILTATNTQPAPVIILPTETTAPTATLTPPTPTATIIPGVGGADKIALLANNDIWTMEMDGSNPMQMTNSDQAKFDLQWLPGGKEILYGEGRCVDTVNVDTLEKSQIACFDGPYFEGFRVSPDGKQVAISIERRVVVVPFDREVLSTATSAFDLQNMNACLDYAEVSVKSAQWSADGKKLAVLYQSVKGQRLADTVRVIDIRRCRDADPLILDEFPARRFTPEGYETYPVLPSYNWDGDQRFLFNTFKRNQGYGELYLYDMFTNEWRLLNPVDNVC
jgi:serine/threonine protein kinase